MLCRRAEGLFKSLITIQYDYTMQSASFSIPISAQICNISMNAATLHRIICPPTAMFKQEDLQNGKRTGKQGKAVPTLLLANLRALPASHLASKVAWSHFSLVGEICPQAPLNDFCKIGCAPAELSSPAARQGIAAWSIFLRRTCGLHRQMTLRYLSVLCQTFGPYHEPHSPHFILPEKSWTPLSPCAVL